MQNSSEQDYQNLMYNYYRIRLNYETSMNNVTQIQSLLEGLSISKAIIEELKDKESDHEIMLPIGNFAYLKARVPEPDKFLISLGRKTLVVRDTKQALDTIRKKQEELQTQLDAARKTLEQTTQQLKQIEPIVAQYQQQADNMDISPP